MLCLSVLESGFYGSVGDAPGDRQPFLLPSVGLDIQMGRAEQCCHPCGFAAALETAKRSERKVQGKTFPEPRGQVFSLYRCAGDSSSCGVLLPPGQVRGDLQPLENQPVKESLA